MSKVPTRKILWRNSAVYSISNLAVFEFDNEIAQFRGIASGDELMRYEKTQDMCYKWIRAMVLSKPVNHNTTFDLKFKTNVSTGRTHVQEALWKYAHGLEIEQSGQILATAMAKFAWSHRYVLIVIGFTYQELPFVTLVLTKSLTNESFVVDRETILAELPSIYARTMEKGILYPHYVKSQDATFEDTAKVYQSSSFADYVAKSLDLEMKPSPSKLAVEVLPMVLPEAINSPSENKLQVLATSIIEHGSQQSLDVRADDAPLTVKVGGVEVTAKLTDVASGTIEVIQTDEVSAVMVRGAQISATIGGSPIPVHLLLSYRKGGDDELSR